MRRYSYRFFFVAYSNLHFRYFCKTRSLHATRYAANFTAESGSTKNEITDGKRREKKVEQTEPFDNRVVEFLSRTKIIQNKAMNSDKNALFFISCINCCICFFSIHCCHCWTERLNVYVQWLNSYKQFVYLFYSNCTDNCIMNTCTYKLEFLPMKAIFSMNLSRKKNSFALMFNLFNQATSSEQLCC